MHVLLSTGQRHEELVVVDLAQLSLSTPDGPCAAQKANISNAEVKGLNRVWVKPAWMTYDAPQPTRAEHVTRPN